MKNYFPFIFILIIFSITYIAGGYLQKKSVSTFDLQRLQLDQCNPTQKICIFGADEERSQFYFLQKPSALTPFSVNLKTDIKNLEHVAVRFYMKDMQMGFNTFELLKTQEGVWQKDVVLPVCSTGTKQWQVELQLIYKNSVQTAVFSFKQSG